MPSCATASAGRCRSRPAPAATDVAQRCRTALDQLDGAAIGTLHSFAQRILSEHPIEAGLPPRVEVLDEVSSGVEFERRWSAFREELLADPALERTILLLLAGGVRANAIDALASAFEDNWDLVDDRVPETAPEPPSVLDARSPTRWPLSTRSCAERARLPRRRRQALRPPRRRSPPTPSSCARSADEYELLDALHADAIEPPSFKVGNLGQKGNWPDVETCAGSGGRGWRAARLGTGDDRTGVRPPARRRHPPLHPRRRRRNGAPPASWSSTTCSSSPARCCATRPTVPTCGLGCTAATQRLLLDEFQDTDPIQIELAVRIAAADPASPASGHAPGTRCRSPPGSCSSSATRSSRSTASGGPTSPPSSTARTASADRRRSSGSPPTSAARRRSSTGSTTSSPR